MAPLPESRDGGRLLNLLWSLKRRGADFDEVFEGKPLLCCEVIYEQQAEGRLRFPVNLVGDFGKLTDSGGSALMLASLNEHLTKTLLDAGANSPAPSGMSEFQTLS